MMEPRQQYDEDVSEAVLSPADPDIEEVKQEEGLLQACGVKCEDVPRPAPGEEPLNLVVRGLATCCPPGVAEFDSKHEATHEDEAGDVDYCSPLAVCSVELTEEGMTSNINLNEFFRSETRGVSACKCNNSRGASYLTSKGKRMPKCLRCGLRRKKMSLDRDSLDKQFGCPVCPAKFTQKCHVKRHMLTHTGERPFLCPICGAKFALNCNFKNHLLIHTGEKPMSCTVCGARFMRASNLKEHMLFHSSEKPFQCTTCKARFTLKSHLKRHVFTHTGEKPFACPICEAKFSRSGNVKDHMKTHTREKPFDCVVCGSKFARRSHVKEHMLTHRDKSFSSPPSLSNTFMLRPRRAATN